MEVLTNVNILRMILDKQKDKYYKLHETILHHVEKAELKNF